MLQRTAGNAAVVRLLGRGVPASGDVVVQRGKESQARPDKGKEVVGKKKGDKRKRGKKKTGTERKEEVADEPRKPDDVERVPDYPDTLPQAEIQKRMFYAAYLLLEAEAKSRSAAAPHTASRDATELKD
ncbi:hypothetical protein [Amycolatopsis sp. lyj-23]|uniref:hypothetical protein n=1 Tax=Amycolatopsis sp. lyj-23 TaxID=2789283 RepID=UPI00397CE8CA